MKDIKKYIIIIILVGVITLICCFTFIKPNKFIKFFSSPIVNTDLTKNNNKNILKLNHTVDYKFETDDILNIESVYIKVGNLPEIKTKVYEEEEYLEPVVKYIKDNFDIDIDHRWNFTINYNGDNIGMIYLIIQSVK